MDLARVIGTVVATRRDPRLGTGKLAIVQPLDEKLRPAGKPLVATDDLNRHRGDLVWIVQSGDAMDAHRGEGTIATDCAIAGLVDSLYVAGEPK